MWNSRQGPHTSTPALFYTFIFATIVHAQSCPSDGDLIYSPFKPWFHFFPGESDQRCWTTAICLLGQADPARNQQFSATALVMGLLPLLLKDIAWPERRIIYVSSPLPKLLEVIVRTFGLVPVEVDATSPTVDEWAARSSPITQWAYKQKRWRLHLWIALSSIALLAAFAATALLEIYSKRSSLGCVYPVFVLTWHIIALLPAAIQTYIPAQENDTSKEKQGKSAVQGGEDLWVVQLCWALYYMGGTLIYTSIMAVTVIELFVWIVVAFIMAGAGKMVAMFACFAFEKIGTRGQVR